MEHIDVNERIAKVLRRVRLLNETLRVAVSGRSGFDLESGIEGVAQVVEDCLDDLVAIRLVSHAGDDLVDAPLSGDDQALLSRISAQLAEPVRVGGAQ